MVGLCPDIYGIGPGVFTEWLVMAMCGQCVQSSSAERHGGGGVECGRHSV